MARRRVAARSATQSLGHAGGVSLRDSAPSGVGGGAWARGGAALYRYPANNTATDQQFFNTNMLEAIGIICAGEAAKSMGLTL